jgi:hypothetical protein
MSPTNCALLPWQNHVIPPPNTKSRQFHQHDTCTPLSITPKHTHAHTKGRLAHGHQPRRMGSEVWEAKPEFKSGMRCEVTGWKLLRRTKHAHPSLLMASLGRRPRRPRGCRHISSLLSSSPNQNNPLHSFSSSPHTPLLPLSSFKQPYQNLPPKFFLKNETPARLFPQQQSQLLPIFGNKNPKKKKPDNRFHNLLRPQTISSPTFPLSHTRAQREGEQKRLSLNPKSESPKTLKKNTGTLNV